MPVYRRLRARDPVLVALFRGMGVPYAQGVCDLVAKARASLERLAARRQAARRSRRTRYRARRARRFKRLE